MSNENTVQYRMSAHSVTAYCTNPRQRCLLYRCFAPLQNLRVIGNEVGKHNFECVVILRNIKDYDVKKGKAQVLDVMKQVCPQCQKHRVR